MRLVLVLEDSQDWYECQKLFADDTIMIQYDSDGIIRAVVDKPVPQRGKTFAVSMLFPINMSVAEISVEDYPAGVTLDRSWKYDGETLYQDSAVVDSNTQQLNTRKRNSLLAKTSLAITVIRCSAVSGNPRDSDSEKLLELQRYVDQLRDVDLTQAEPVWSAKPDF